MYLCETQFLALHPDQLYVFRVHPGCEKCRKLAESDPRPQGDPSRMPL